MKKCFFLLLAGLISQSTFANETIFACFMKNGKLLAVQEVGNQYQYSYGRPGNPEMVFTNSKVAVENTRYSAISTEVNIEMKNKGVSYLIWSNPFASDEGGVIVTKNGKQLADIQCDPNREVIGL